MLFEKSNKLMEYKRMMCNSEKELKISVVMATYNGEKFIKEQLDSILHQSVAPSEIIICDDLSSDNTIKILEEYKNNYSSIIKYYVNSVNKGYAKNFWEAIRIAEGDVIVLSDQDDIWKKNKIQIVKSTFENDESVLALNMAYSIIDTDGNIVHDKKFIRFKDDGKMMKVPFYEFIKSPRYPGMSMAFRKSLFNSVSDVDENLITAHDWMLNQKAAKLDGMFFLDSVTSFYRQHGNNTFGVNATLNRELMYKARIKVIEDEIRNYKHLVAIYGMKDSFIKKLDEVGEKRLLYFQQKNLLKIMFYFITHKRYIATRGGMGDIYVTIKAKVHR